MSNEHKKGPGGHYSGTNPVPNIQRFIESMDANKKSRDAKIMLQANANDDEIKAHKAGQPTGVPGSRKTVTDPITGKQVQIEDVNADFMKAVDEPQVSLYVLQPSRSRY